MLHTHGSHHIAPAGLPEGTRVRLLRTVDPYPLGAWRPGTTGTVAWANPDSVDHVIAGIRLDERFEALDEWGNELHVSRDADEGPTTWSDWEALPAPPTSVIGPIGFGFGLAGGLYLLTKLILA